MNLNSRKVDFDKTWVDLKETISGVLLFKDVTRSAWNDGFNNIYALCVAHPEPFADRLYTETENFLMNHLKELQCKLEEKQNSQLLDAYSESWEQFSYGIGYLNMLYRYLNQQHIKKPKSADSEFSYTDIPYEENDQSMKEIRELSLGLWKTSILETLKERMIPLILDCIGGFRTKDNSKHQIYATSALATELNDAHGNELLPSHFSIPPTNVGTSENTIQTIIASFLDVEEYNKKNEILYYQDLFESALLESTRVFFAKESAKLLQEEGISSYIQKVTQNVQLETKRSLLLYPKSQGKVLKEVLTNFVGNHLTLLHSQCKTIIQDGKLSDLGNIYRLLKPIDGAMEVLLKEFLEHITAYGINVLSEIVNNDYPDEFVEAILKTHGKFQRMIQEFLLNDHSFSSALDTACVDLVNLKFKATQPIAGTSELLVRYCDTLLKKSKKVNEVEIDIRLENFMTVFKYIEEKDKFQQIYAKYLAKRLIQEKSCSMDLEEGMLKRFKNICGYEFTSNLHKMFTDCSLSENLQSNFESHLKASTMSLPIGFSVKVLQQAAWPLNANSKNTSAIPIEIEKCMLNYDSFYTKQFSGRKLVWLHDMSLGEVKWSHQSKIYFLTMNTHQLALILLFQHCDQLQMQELLDATELSKEHLRMYLKSLINHKLLVVNDKELGSDCSIRLNLEYCNKRSRVMLNRVGLKDSPQEAKQTERALHDDRKMYIQATLVRVMKCRKVLKHEELIQEVLNQSKARFAPSVPMIKTCIEGLIEKAYLERDSKSNDLYHYIV